MRPRRFAALALAAAVMIGPVPAVSEGPDTVTLVCCGDVIPHYEVMEAARQGTDWDLRPVFEPVADLIAGADYAFCTLESPIAEPLSYYPQFSAPEALPRDLMAVGFDMFCLASNHICDRRFRGICSTLDALDRLGADHTGIYRSPEERAEQRGVLIREIGGITFAFLDYTSTTNQYRMEGQEFAVRTLYADFWSTAPRMLLDEDITLDIQTAKAAGADVILAVCHWGTEFHTVPDAAQQELADFMIGQGVDVILGSHPHVPQTAERRTVTGPDGTERTGVVFFSMGNFLSAMTNDAGDVTPLVELEFHRDPDIGKPELLRAEYRPLYRCWDKHSPEPFHLVDTDRIRAGELPGWADEGLIQKAEAKRERLLAIVGQELYGKRQ